MQESRDDFDSQGTQEAVRLQELFLSQMWTYKRETTDNGRTGNQFCYNLFLNYVLK